jgi:hypothetical protein
MLKLQSTRISISDKSVDIPLPCNPSNFKQRAPRVCLLFWKSNNLLIYFFLINNKAFIERNLQPYSEGYKPYNEGAKETQTTQILQQQIQLQQQHQTQTVQPK